MLKRFLRDTRGNIAMMFGLMAIPLIAATGAAIDYSRAYEQRQVVQDALDAAALAANKLIGLATEEEIYAEALAFFLANTEGRLDNTLVLNMVIDGGSVRLTTDLPVPTYFLGIVGVDNINFDLVAMSIAGAATYEVVLVLDNSGSMSGTKIATLQAAATALINSLFALNVSNPAPNPVRIGIVPFAASVNVGPSNATAAWMDTTGLSPNSPLNFNATQPTAAGNPNPFTNTFNMFSRLSGSGYIGWGGCVEARQNPYDTNDATPTTTVPATLFTPMFAPDEPGGAGSPKTGFNNSYISDTGGTCVNTETTTTTGGGTRPWWCSFWPTGPGCNTTTTTTTNISFTDLQLQERACKYQGAAALSSSYNGMGEGPNRHCTTNAITPLSTNQTALIAAVTAMQAGGYTNIEEGIAWGWRVLSDNAPFTEGRAYGESGNHKIMIVMTDGANTYVEAGNTLNETEYLAFNYIVHNYLGTTSGNENTIVTQMNARTLEVCDNIHDTEITVYTIAFQVEDDDAQEILLQCASSPNKAYDAENNAELIAIFQLIAQDVATLRIAE